MALVVQAWTMHAFAFMLMVWLSTTPAAAKQGISAFARTTGLIQDGQGVVQLARQNFVGRDLISPEYNADVRKAVSNAEWYVLFCPARTDDVSEDTCQEAKARVRLLSALPWGDFETGDKSGAARRQARFGVVDCDAEPQLCKDQGFFDATRAETEQQRSAVVVRYSASGSRAATWEPERQVGNDSKQVAQQLANWVRKEFAANPQSSGGRSNEHTYQLANQRFVRAVASLRAAVDPVLIDPATAATGIILLVGQLAVVAWVICSGFELWPAAVSK